MKRSTVAKLLSVYCAWAAVAAIACGSLHAGDLGLVPLFDGERQDSLNLWGGPFNNGNIVGVTKQSSFVHSGTGAYRADLGSIPADGFRFFQTFSSEVNGTPGYRQDRDLTQYSMLEGYVHNGTATNLTFSLELKDYRDSLSHRAIWTLDQPLATGAWTKIEVPLDLGTEWQVTGSPELERTFALGFLIDADYGPASGSLYLDDFSLRENGPSIDVASEQLDVLVERLAQRQFHALWAARNKTTGIIPNSSDNVVLGALNTTTGVVWSLPAAIRRGWVAQSEADAYMGQLVNSLNLNRDQTNYLPTRFLDFVTAGPVTDHEESTIDAAFIALALHNYKSQPDTPISLRDSIDLLQDRFNFSVFSGPGAFGHGYIPATGLIPYTYSGFTNENKIIAMAAELSNSYHVPLEDQWNKETGRVSTALVNTDDKYLVYSSCAPDNCYRAPFAQALVNLFVDTSDRGVDSYPNRALARNPWINFLKYEDDVSAELDQLGRDSFFQPDAGQGAGGYQPYNLFEGFGQPDLFMPWSTSFALLAGADNAEAALRFLLDSGLGGGLDGPLGLADSAQWDETASDPTQVPSFADNWNMALSTMALLEFLDRYQGIESGSQFFASLAEVSSALDEVFRDGDLNGDGVANGTDLALWESGYGITNNASPAFGDADGDGDVDGMDFLRWQRGYGSSTFSDWSVRVQTPEPSAFILSCCTMLGLICRSHRCHPRSPSTRPWSSSRISDRSSVSSSLAENSRVTI